MKPSQIALLSFGGIITRDAAIELAGATNATTHMDGGELTGSPAGVGSVEYFGAISRESVEVSGLGSVRAIEE